MESCENKTGIIFPIAVFFDQIDFFVKVFLDFSRVWIPFLESTVCTV